MLSCHTMSKRRRMEIALKRAKASVGGNTELAKKLGNGRDGLTPQAVSQWKIVPPHRVLAVERATGVPRQELRSDLYPT